MLCRQETPNIPKQCWKEHEEKRLRYQVRFCKVPLRRALQKIVYKISLTGSVEAAVQDPFARLSVQSVCGSPQRRSLQKISQFAPCHNERDPTRPKWREGCPSDLKMSTAPQRQRSENVTRGLRERSPSTPFHARHPSKTEDRGTFVL